MEDARFVTRIEQIDRDLDRYTYYELFNLPATAMPDEIRRAFHKMALMLHPDRFANHADQSLSERVYRIYKRMTEGYRVLMDPQARRTYDEGLSRGERRYAPTERKRSGPKRPDAEISHPQAKRFFNMALDALRRKDYQGAKMNLQFAKNLAGELPAISEKLAEVEDALGK